MRGCDRFTWVGGKWSKFDEHDNKIGEVIETRLVLKHPEAEERYIFEILCPPENYGTADEWEQQTHRWIEGRKVETLGPYPGEGEYELVKVIEKEYVNKKGVCWKKEYVPLTPTIVDVLLATAIANRDLPADIRQEYRRRQREKEEGDRKQKIENKFLELETNHPAWAKHPNVIVPDMTEILKYS